MQKGIDTELFFYIKKHNLILPGEQILLAFSGGADSLYLLYLLKELQKHIAFYLEAMHVHHGIRGKEAERDLEFSKSKAEEWGIPFSFVRVDVPGFSEENGFGLEEAGRILRYEALKKRRAEWEKETGCVTKLALAQHMDDQAETIVHNFLRGSGVSGFSGMKREEGHYIRPLLSIRKQDIIGRLQVLSLEYMEDESNLDERFTRNYIRKNLIPAMEEVNERAVEHLSEEAELMSELELYLEQKALEFLRSFGKEEGESIAISLMDLKEEPALLRREIYRVAVRKLRGEIRDLARAHLYALDRLIFSGSGKRTELPKGYIGEVRNKFLYLGKRDEKAGKL